MKRKFLLLLPALLFSLTGCKRETAQTSKSSTANGPALIRLNDVFSPNDIKGRLSTEELKIKPTIWKFDGSDVAPFVTNNAATTFGWQAGPGVTDMELKGGHLVGKSTNGYPIIYVERASGLADLDRLHGLEVKMRVSAGTNATTRLMGPQPETLDFKAILEELEIGPWLTKTKISPGEKFETYLLTPKIFETTSRIKRILFNPTDVPNTIFEIESIRLVFRQEHLAEIPSASGWHSLNEISHEALVARTPEIIEIPLNLPAQPRLDLSLGTIQEGPIQFQVGVRANAAPADQNQWVMRRTMTLPHKWEPVQIDLARYAGQKVVLTLALGGSTKGLLGFWGSPVVWNMAAARQAKADHPNRPQGVIVIWSDTTRPDHLSFYGYNRETAPTLAKMAAGGTLFEHCFGQATWTKVATPSLFTSLHPRTHGVHDILDRLPASAETMAEVFRKNGYSTVSFSSLPFTGEASNMHQGFQELHEGASLQDMSKESKNSREFVGRANEWIERNRELPFFMFLHLFDAHDPYEPRAPYNTLWAKPEDSDTYAEMCKKTRPFIENVSRRVFGKGMPFLAEVKKAGVDPEAFARIEKDWYDGSIRGLDDEISRLRERLEELGLSERVLIVYASDHGEEFFEHGQKMHCHTAYGELNHVALFFTWPGSLPAGGKVPVAVRTIDVMPTILELCDLQAPAGIQGQSLVPLILKNQSTSALHARGEWKPVPVITERFPVEGMVTNETVAIIVDQWKLVHNSPRDEGMPEFELYDWMRDPFDQKNLAAANPDTVKRMSAQLNEWKGVALAAKLKNDSELEKSLSSQDIQRLRALGYLK